MELDEQHRKNSLIQSICLNKSTRQYPKQHAKQSTDLRVALTGSLDLQDKETSKYTSKNT